MSQALVIVESPAKAKTINKYLGKDFLVKSCVGHIRDLPVGSRKNTTPPTPPKDLKEMTAQEKEDWRKQKQHIQLVNNMGVDPESDWRAHYEVLPGKEKVVKELKQYAKKASCIYLATDLDREGEAIAWHLRELLGGKDENYKRVVFNEITKSAIKEAFNKPAHINMPRVEAQQTRRFLDRVVGFMLSPLLWKKIARGLSAGRVQSVAVRLVAERESEIRAFKPEEYWEIHSNLKIDNNTDLRCQVTKYQGKPFKSSTQESTQKAVDVLEKATYNIANQEKKAGSTKPPAPFITSTLQQAASTRLGFGVKKTMMMAQRLYEAGFITYMRTDSTNLSKDAVEQCRGYIKKQFGDTYLPEKASLYASKDSAQEAHEAIRPSDVTKKSTDLAGVENDAQKLYDLIWRQFVACQMPPSKYQTTTINIKADDYELKAKGRIITFDGFLKVLPPVTKKEDVVLPKLETGQDLPLKEVIPSQHFTKPPARYNEASLVKELEKRGIGRPSTYASIISTIQDRGYVHIENKRFYADKVGEIVTNRLTDNFPLIMGYDFTAQMEKQLDEIANGQTQWKEVLNTFYKDFSKKLEKAYDNETGMRGAQSIETTLSCKQCQRPMAIRNGSTGTFLGCTGFSEKGDEQCKTTQNLTPEHEILSNNEEAEAIELKDKKRCEICQAAMESFIIDEKTKIHICGNNPNCGGYVIETGEFKMPYLDIPTIECDKCSADMELKTGRFGKYFGCTNEACKNTRKVLKNGEAAPPKMDPIPMPDLACIKVKDHYVLRDGASGLFLAASQFPKHRETRAPLIAELNMVKDKLDPKYHYLLSAPEKDPEGNKTIVRFSRKMQESYVTSEKDGKNTNWRIFYKDNQWQQASTKK